MYYYQQNNQIQTITQEEGDQLIEKHAIVEVEKTYTEPALESGEVVVIPYKDYELQTTETKYIDTLGVPYTTEEPPEVGEYQKILLTDGSWEVVDFTDEEKQVVIDSKLAKIDEETEAKLLAGFTFNEVQFSTSIPAQINWSDVFILHQSGSFPSEGLTISTKDNHEYLLADDQVTHFMNAYNENKKAILTEGREKKKALTH